MSATLSTRELLDRMVAFDTTSVRSNLALADFIAEYAEHQGASVERHPSPEGDKTCLVVRYGPTRTDGAGLMLSGHMDVVPADEDGWRSDPFAVTETDDLLRGRGTCDMKGFLACATNALTGTAPSEYPLVLLFTYDEEVGTLGSRHFVETYAAPETLPRRTIIGEPTGLAPVRMHKGHLKLRIATSGQSAHSGLPHLGINAIEPAARAVTALSTVRARLERERPAHHEHFPDVPYAALNVAMISGGRAINIVPDVCTIDVGVRTLPGMDADAMVELIRTELTAALGPDGYTLELQGESPPMLLDADADLLTSFHDGHDHGASFATDAGWLQRLGCECVLWGPGDMSNAHRPNEYVGVADLQACDEALTPMIHRWCHPA